MEVSSMAENARVLIVEDEKDISELMSLHLKREGHDVTAVDNGEDAIKTIEGNGYQLLVLDWMLPGVSGLELCKKIRARGGLPIALPVLLHSDAVARIFGVVTLTPMSAVPAWLHLGALAWTVLLLPAIATMADAPPGDDPHAPVGPGR